MYTIIDGIRYHIKYVAVLPLGCEPLPHGYMTNWTEDSDGIYIAYRLK